MKFVYNIFYTFMGLYATKCQRKFLYQCARIFGLFDLNGFYSLFIKLKPQILLYEVDPGDPVSNCFFLLCASNSSEMKRKKIGYRPLARSPRFCFNFLTNYRCKTQPAEPMSFVFNFNDTFLNDSDENNKKKNDDKEKYCRHAVYKRNGWRNLRFFFFFI